MTASAPTVSGPWVRLIRLHLESRRVLPALAAILACAIALRVALHWPWTAYGALQLPLIAEAGCAVAITATTASPFGDPERVTGRRLRFLRLGVPVLLIAVAAAVLGSAGLGTSLAGGNLEMLRNLVGLTGIGLLCAVAFGGALAWAGPTAYLIVGVYALYTLWHGPALTTPWIWPGRPAHDLGAAACAGATVAMGLMLIAVRGARELSRE